MNDLDEVQKRERQLQEMAVEVLGTSFSAESDVREMREKLNSLLKLESERAK